MVFNRYVKGVGALLAGLLLGASLPLSAADQEAEIKTVRQSMGKLLPGMALDNIQPAPLPGLYEVIIGTDVVYVTADGRYLLRGSIIDIDSRKDLTAPRIEAANRSMIEGVGEENMVIYGPKDAAHTVTVFTDIDCGYCRKLHAEMDGYIAEGMRVRYLFYPRAGIGSNSYKKAVSVWCADDSNEAMTLAKSGKPVEQKECANPVADQFELGKRMGVSGTPSLVLDDGELLPGYLPPKRLSAHLKFKQQAAKQ